MGFNSLPRQEPRKKNQHYILVLWCKVSKGKSPYPYGWKDVYHQQRKCPYLKLLSSGLSTPHLCYSKQCTGKAAASKASSAISYLLSPLTFFEQVSGSGSN